MTSSYSSGAQALQTSSVIEDEDEDGGGCGHGGGGGIVLTASTQAAAKGLAESLGALIKPKMSGQSELVTALWAWGQLASGGAFTPVMLCQFEEALREFKDQHLSSAAPAHVAMAVSAMAHLAEGGHRINNSDLERIIVMGAVDRFAELLKGGAKEEAALTSSQIRCDDVLGDLLHALAVVGQLPPQHDKLSLMAHRAAQQDVIDERSPRTLSRVLWALARLQFLGCPPLLPPRSTEWRRLCEGFIWRASELTSSEAAPALALFEEALQWLAASDGRRPQCINNRLERCYRYSAGRACRRF